MCAAVAMRTTVGLLDELYRRAKAEAALRRRNFKDLVEEGLRRVLRAAEPETSAERSAGPSVHDLMRDCCGIAKNAPADLCDKPEILGGVIPQRQRRGTKKRQLRGYPELFPPKPPRSLLIPSRSGRPGKEDCPELRLRAPLLISTSIRAAQKHVVFDANSLEIQTKYS